MWPFSPTFVFFSTNFPTPCSFYVLLEFKIILRMGGVGLTSVEIKGLDNRTIDLFSYTWTYKVLFFQVNYFHIVKFVKVKLEQCTERRLLFLGKSYKWLF